MPPSTKPNRRTTQIVGQADETLLDLKRAVEKFQRQQDGIVKAEGPSASASSVAITKRWLPELAEGIRKALADTRGTRRVHAEFLAVIHGLEPGLLALCILQGTLHGIGREQNYLKTAIGIARAIQGECWAKGLIKRDPKFAKRTEERVRRKYPSSKRREQAARAIAARYGYKTTNWSDELCLHAGNWALDLLLKTLPDVFSEGGDNEKGEKLLTITDSALEYASAFVADIIQRHPVWLPRTEAPLAWTGLKEGVTKDKRLALSLSLIRTRHEHTRRAVNKAIRSRKMQPAVDALNALQAVPWAINKPILSVLKACWEKGIAVPGLPRKEPIPMPKFGDWEKYEEEERAYLRRMADAVRLTNLAIKGGHFQINEDIETAESLAKCGRFWTPMNFDFRGRIDALPHFNFQREDRVRALFLFGRQEPIGEEGLYWLKVHTANCGDFDKISKKAFLERVKWVDDNLSLIQSVADAPLMDRRWIGADKPFRFLAACMELSAAVKQGPSYVSSIPVSFDGSCNGLQHLCAMTRAPEGSLVNLTPNVKPQDIYQKVAECVRVRIENDDSEADFLCREQWLKRDIDRKTVKQDVMTYFYGSTERGMTDKRLEAVISVQGELFNYKEPSLALSKYLTENVRAAIEGVVDLPAKAMTFLQELAKIAAANNKSLEWSPPVGLPWCNRYYEKDINQVRLWLQDRQHTIKLASDRPIIDRPASARGAAPNFVHACDAAHLMLTVNAAVAEGITSIATVHDCFGCLPSRAERFREIIRKQFVRMYKEHDVLQEVLDQARADLGNIKGMPDAPPQRGDLDHLDQMLYSDYAFA